MQSNATAMSDVWCAIQMQHCAVNTTWFQKLLSCICLMILARIKYAMCVQRTPREARRLNLFSLLSSLVRETFKGHLYRNPGSVPARRTRTGFARLRLCRRLLACGGLDL